MNPVLVVRQTTHGTTGEPLGRGCWVWCPGCDEAHRFVISNEDGTIPSGPVWTWDGDLEHPTFEASLLVNGGRAHPDRAICHSYVRGGRWEFLSDSTHKLAGQTVDMVPLPDWLARA